MVECVALDEAGVVQHNTPVPYYFQLATYVEEKIKSKAWAPGRLLPSEEEFCDRLGVSRTVVRQALSDLERKGLITKKNGKRSSVAFAQYDSGLMQNLRGFYEDAIAKGQRPSTKVLKLSLTSANPEVAEALQMREGDSVVKLNRLRFLDDEPEVLVTSYLPERLTPSLVHEDLTDKSLYELLAHKYNLRIARGQRTIEAVSVGKGDAKLLKVKPGSPILLLKSIGVLENGAPLEYYIAKHRGDRSKFHVQLIREHD